MKTTENPVISFGTETDKKEAVIFYLRSYHRIGPCPAGPHTSVRVRSDYKRENENVFPFIILLREYFFIFVLFFFLSLSFGRVAKEPRKKTNYWFCAREKPKCQRATAAVGWRPSAFHSNDSLLNHTPLPFRDVMTQRQTGKTIDVKPSKPRSRSRS